MSDIKKTKPTQKRARDPKSQELVRQNIIKAARELFNKDGYDSVSMRKVAKACGYSAGTLYLYFSNKKELLNQLWYEDLTALNIQFKKIIARDIAPIEKIESFFLDYIKYWIDNPDNYKIGFGSILEGEDAGFQNVEQDLSDFIADAFDVIRSAQEQGQIKKEIEVRDFWKVLVAGAHGVLSVHYSYSIINADPMEYAELMMGTLLNGWK